MFDIHRVEIDWGGRKLKLETGRMARQADAAVFAQYGETSVLATVVALDPLRVVFSVSEKTYLTVQKEQVDGQDPNRICGRADRFGGENQARTPSRCWGRRGPRNAGARRSSGDPLPAHTRGEL